MKNESPQEAKAAWKKAATVLLKLFIIGNATPLAPSSAWAELYFLNVNNIQSTIPEDQKNIMWTLLIDVHLLYYVWIVFDERYVCVTKMAFLCCFHSFASVFRWTSKHLFLSSWAKHPGFAYCYIISFKNVH